MLKLERRGIQWGQIQTTSTSVWKQSWDNFENLVIITKNQTAQTEEMKKQRQEDMLKWINEVNVEEDDRGDVIDLTKDLLL